MSRRPHFDPGNDSSETLIRSLTEEQDALRAELGRCRARLDHLRALHSDEKALLESALGTLAAVEEEGNEARATRDALRPQYERLVAQELRLRTLARSHGLQD